MISNLDRYKKDLDALIMRGKSLELSLQASSVLNSAQLTEEQKNNAKEAMKEFRDFLSDYQPWYSEAKMLIKQLLPHRLDDFVRHYEKPKFRKSIDLESYRIEDALQGLFISGLRGNDIDPSAAIPHLKQQIAIVKSVQARFESSLFEIHQLVQADIFDSELAAAKELLKHKFIRAAGAVAGVVLEKHLLQVCENHQAPLKKKHPTIATLNDALKELGTIEVSQWRFIQHLADIRNKCDHADPLDPTASQVTDLIEGVMKVTKTIL